MLCSIFKRKISRATDTGRPLFSRAESHLRRCANCREFARLNTDLEARLTRDAAVLLKGDRVSLSDKVLLSLDRNNTPLSLPSRISVKPVWAAAAASAIILVAVVLASRFWFVAPRPDKMPSLQSLLKYDPPASYIKKAVQKAEFPYQQEIRELKKALGSAASIIEGSFDIGLAEKTQKPISDIRKTNPV